MSADAKTEAETKAGPARVKRRRTPKRGDTPFDRFVRDTGLSELRRLTGLRGAAGRVAASHLIRAAGDAPVLYVTPHSRAADDAILALRGFLGEREDESRIRAFPRHDTLPFDRFSPQPFLVSQRMEVLHRLDVAAAGDAEEPPPIVVAPRSRATRMT